MAVWEPLNADERADASDNLESACEDICFSIRFWSSRHLQSEASLLPVNVTGSSVGSRGRVRRRTQQPGRPCMLRIRLTRMTIWSVPVRHASPLLRPALSSIQSSLISKMPASHSNGPVSGWQLREHPLHLLRIVPGVQLALGATDCGHAL